MRIGKGGEIVPEKVFPGRIGSFEENEFSNARGPFDRITSRDCPRPGGPFAGTDKIRSLRLAVDYLPFPDPLKGLHMDGVHMRIFLQIVFAERHRERFRLES